ncbi:MAG: immunoglobulin domain-containing protein, partial [Limisphaerales bacterium]
KLNCTLPTAKMVNQIWTKAPCKLAPSPIPWSPEMVTVPVFIDHNNTVRGQRFAVTNTHPLGTLVGGTKKDVIISGRIYTAFANANITKPVVIYGWHQLNGSNIQGVYNGHEETYVDYSHGIRLVQMPVTLNGQPNTITNILTNPNLAGIISDDPYYTANTIPVPRYPNLQPVAPFITTPPVSQTVTVGSTVSLRAFAIGDGTLSYQWRINGSNILNATNATLTLSNVQTNDSANYTVVVSSSLGTANAAATLSVVPATPVRFDSISSHTNGSVELVLSGADGQSYVVHASSNLVTWRPISVLAISNGPLPFVDLEAIHLAERFYKAKSGATSWLTTFENSSIGSSSMFLNPVSSGSTLSFLNTNAPTFAVVTNNLPATGTNKLLWVGWSFNGTANPWLRLTTFNAPQLPNPTIGFNQALLFDIYSSQDLYVSVGLRETGTSAAIGSDGGSTGTIEWIGTTLNPPRGRLVPANQWTTLQFFIPFEPVRAFTGNGILSSPTSKGVLEHLAFAPAGGEMEHRVLLDNFRVVDLMP